MQVSNRASDLMWLNVKLSAEGKADAEEQEEGEKRKKMFNCAGLWL